MQKEGVYEIWSEGYIIQGNSGGAVLMGTYPGETFDEAVSTMLIHDPTSRKYYRQTDNKHYIWGCRLFDNEKDARKSFG